MSLPASQMAFLQIGDIHYPDLLSADPLADAKGSGVSPLALASISATRISEVTKALNRVRIQEPNLRAVLLTGDLTSRGQLTGYRDCIRFLRTALAIEDASYWANCHLIVVPGNHDIDRSAIKLGDKLENKFIPLANAWASICGTTAHFGSGSPDPVDVRHTGKGATPTLRIMALNTCYMCGEHRAFPEAVRAKVLEAFDGARASLTPEQYYELMTEQVDCPSVERTHVDTLTRQIAASSTTSVNIVLGHHPLLAQPIPRVVGFAELINAGFVRESLLSARRNVIYLHGHIHQDPLLVVSNPPIGAHRLIHISAPALEDGFNLVRVFFSEETQMPLGLQLIPFRFGDELGLRERDAISLTLIDRGALWNEVEHRTTTAVLDQLSTPARVLRFNEVVEKLPPRIRKGKSTEELRAEVKNSLLKLELLEIVHIANRQMSEQHWQCTRRSV